MIHPQWRAAAVFFTRKETRPMHDPLAIKDPESFEKHIGVLFQNAGWKVIAPPANTRGYDLELQRDGHRIAVQVKNYTRKCSLADVEKFRSFLELPLADGFAYGVFVSASGFSKNALLDVEANQREVQETRQAAAAAAPSAAQPTPRPAGARGPKPVKLVEYRDGRLLGAALEAEASQPPANCRYIGVFTCKGGVGKTTTAAHLAGAFALMGHDVILLDLDPDQNLHKLFRADTDDAGSEASLFVPALMKNQPGATITVLSHAQWQQSNAGDYRDAKVVICDCSPVLAENPAGLIGQFDYCIIPTTLNPLGIAKNANVITRTFAHIRSLNPRAELFCLINGYDSSKAVEKKNEVLLTHLQKEIDRYAQHDPKCRLIPPDEAKVRHSSALLYWGYHIVDGSRPQLAFREVAGRSYPRTDFLQLAEYLENHTDLATLREPRG